MLRFSSRDVSLRPPPDFRRPLRFYYIQTFCYDFIFGYAIFPAFFQLQGVSPEIIATILAFWAAGIIALEIPSGILADIMDRRILLVLSPICKATCFLIWIFSDGRLELYFAGMAFWSLASALRSGTKEALLFDHVSHHDQIPQYTAILSKERALQEFATPLGAIMGGLIAQLDLELVFWTSMVPLLICAIASAHVVVPHRARERALALVATRIPTLLHATWNEFMLRRQVRRVTLYVALCVTFLGTLEDFNQLFLLAINAPIWSLGLIVGGLGILRIAFAYQAHRLERVPAFTSVAPFCSGLALFVSGFLTPVWAAIAMAAAFILIAPLLVLTTSEFQKALDGVSRATTTSVMSAFVEIVSVAFNLLIAFLFSQLDVLKTYQLGGLYLVCLAIWEIRHPPHTRASSDHP